MKAGGALLPWAVVLGLSGGMLAVVEEADGCTLPSQHAGVTFPVEHIGPEWACRLHPIVTNYTTANKIGPIGTPLPEAMYLYLLDRPPMAAALINRLDLGLYRAETRGSGRYWGNDGEGTEGTVELVYQDRTTRVYYLEGSHNSRLLPHLTGKAVVFLRLNAVKERNGVESVESTMVSYTRLDNRVWSGLVSLLRPLVGGTVTRKLLKGVESVNRLSRLMRLEPDRVLFEATDPPGLPDEDVVFLREALAGMGRASSSHQASPAP